MADLNTAQKIGLGLAGVGLLKKYLSPSAGAVPPGPIKPIVTFGGATGAAEPVDLRVKLRIPDSYLAGLPGTDIFSLPGYVIKKHNGIIFPYTPQITYDTFANYSNMNLMHSNQPMYSYKGSGISAINLSAKFTNQNDDDGGAYLIILHTLRALTKMKFGSDPDAGAPPPVCRLDAYGDYMLKNVPVVVSNFRIELPDNVDYYRVGNLNFGGSAVTFHENLVPTVSTIALTLIPMYSRAEQLAFNVTGWKDGSFRGQGYL